MGVATVVIPIATREARILKVFSPFCSCSFALLVSGVRPSTFKNAFFLRSGLGARCASFGLVQRIGSGQTFCSRLFVVFGICG